jgi:hypothetical protein
MLGKLNREISRACAAVLREDTADHCTNAAWTAWHLAEWVWADIKYDEVLKAELAREAGVRGRRFKYSDFIDFVQSEGQCPELVHLRIITVTSKHVGAGPYDDLAFVIDASAASETVGPDTGLDWLPVYDYGDRPLWIFKIVEGENRSKVIPWLNKARDYWASFINDRGIAQG